MTPDTQRLLAQLRALTDPVKLRLAMLCARGECSVSELTEVLSLSQPRVSQHLKALCDAALVERFRDGHFVYYRAATADPGARVRRRIVELLPGDEPLFERDAERLRALRSDSAPPAAAADDRALHNALVELTVAAPVGDLLDIGCGYGRILKLLASRARQAVGVDIDADARRFARAGLLLAELPNCTLRQGDMYDLPFDDASFDTVILDDVLRDASDPESAVREAARLLRRSGRLWVLSAVQSDGRRFPPRVAKWCQDAGLRMAPARAVPAVRPRWLVAVATLAQRSPAAA